uniref:MSP domain-containing protein n=1 Tax=Panagrellus redivivus TaxID=6233 RepID=A0A7E4W5X8_PANRE
MPPKHDMGAQPIYDITIAAVAAIKTTSALRRQLPLTVDTLKKNLDKAKRTSFNIEEFDPNQPDSNVILLRAQFDTRKNMEFKIKITMNGCLLVLLAHLVLPGERNCAQT